MTEAASRVLRPEDGEYPRLLRECDDRPAVLYARGRRLDELGPFVAIVGARAPTACGREVARDFAAGLARRGICVVSGMARGIDAAAHSGALEAGGTTVAVLAAGVGRPYPPGNRRLYERILDRGAAVSELADGPSLAHLFPVRNRIIAGMSYGVIVVQGRAGSGTKSTADRAAQYGREVFAVPGDVRSELSAFPHALIRQGACLCRSVDDALEVLESLPDWQRHALPAGERDPPRRVDFLDEPSKAILRALSIGPGPVEEIVARSGLDAAVAARVLGRLELAGMVARGEGGTYRKAD